MTLLFDIWYTFAPRIRLYCWLSWTLMLGVIAAFCLLSEATGGEESLNTQRTASRQLWQNLYRIAGTGNDTFDKQAPETLSFLPLSLQIPDVQLLHWQPSAQGGELAVKAEWNAIPPLFAYLAERGMSVEGFSVATENHSLKLTLKLGTFHEGE